MISYPVQLIATAIDTLFINALLASGRSASIVCILAGQIVCQGHIKWSLTPWVRRIATRLLLNCSEFMY